MKPFFALAPWEFPGADFDPTPHATTRADIGGRERTIWIKMREGVIYFKDAEHARVYAVTRLSDDEIAVDAERLVAVWKAEIARENYGAFLVIRHRFPRSFATASCCIILQADGSGWIKEHFDRDWTKFYSLLPEPLRLWGRKPLGHKGEFIFQQMHSHFLERAVSPAHFQSIEPRWTNGSAEEMMTVARSAAQLWQIPYPASKTLEWICQSNSAFFNESSILPFRYASHYQSTFNEIQEWVRWHYAFVGIAWIKATENAELQEQMRYKQRKNWLRSVDKWGENWRGNWSGTQFKLQLFAPPISNASMHDKLEAARVMQKFLAGRMPADEIEAILRDAL